MQCLVQKPHFSREDPWIQTRLTLETTDLMLEGGLNILWKVMSLTLEFSTVTKNMIQQNLKGKKKKEGRAEEMDKAAKGSSG